MKIFQIGLGTDQQDTDFLRKPKSKVECVVEVQFVSVQSNRACQETAAARGGSERKRTRRARHNIRHALVHPFSVEEHAHVRGNRSGSAPMRYGRLHFDGFSRLSYGRGESKAGKGEIMPLSGTDRDKKESGRSVKKRLPPQGVERKQRSLKIGNDVDLFVGIHGLPEKS